MSPVYLPGSDGPMSPPLPIPGGGDLAAPPPYYNKEARMARALTLSALYVLALGTLFGAYALTL